MSRTRDDERLDRVLGEFVQRVACVRAVLLTTHDGLSRNSAGVANPNDAERLGAVSSCLFLLEETVGSLFLGKAGTMRHVVLEAEEGIMFITRTEANYLLVVLASREAAHSLIRYELGMLSQKVGSCIVPPPR